MLKPRFGLLNPRFGALVPRFGLLNPRFGAFVPRFGLLNPPFPLLFTPRLGLLNPRFGLLNPPFALFTPRFGLLNPRFAPPFGVNPRGWLPRAETGGVKVCHPGREEVIGGRAPALAREFKPDEGLLNEPAPRFALNPDAGRDVLVGRFELNPPRAASVLLRPKLPRDAVKNRCVFDGAWRYEAGLAARLTGL